LIRRTKKKISRSNKSLFKSQRMKRENNQNQLRGLTHQKTQRRKKRPNHSLKVKLNLFVSS